MASSIVGDAKYQELNMSFTFDEQNEDKKIINAIADHTPYQLQLLSSLELDFEDFKNALLSKQFKIVFKSPEILKLKIGFTFFEFKNVEKITLNALKETITELSIKLKEQTQKNIVLEDGMKQLRKDVDLLTNQLKDLRCANDETKQQFIKVKTTMSQQNEDQKAKIDSLKKQVMEFKNENDCQRKGLKNEKVKNQIQDEKIRIPEGNISIIEDKVHQKFLNEHKSNEITLSDNNCRATNTNGSSTCALALVKGFVFKKGSQIRFKIEKIGIKGVGVGLALKSVVASTSYHMKNYQKIGHGCIILFPSGYLCSHCNKEENCVHKDFRYEVGDVVRVETNDNELLFKNEKKNTEYKMKLSLTEDEWKQAHFCVLLQGSDDSISIL